MSTPAPVPSPPLFFIAWAYPLQVAGNPPAHIPHVSAKTYSIACDVARPQNRKTAIVWPAVDTPIATLIGNRSTSAPSTTVPNMLARLQSARPTVPATAGSPTACAKLGIHSNGMKCPRLCRMAPAAKSQKGARRKYPRSRSFGRSALPRVTGRRPRTQKRHGVRPAARMAAKTRRVVRKPYVLSSHCERKGTTMPAEPVPAHMMPYARPRRVWNHSSM